MATYVPILDTQLDPDAPLTSSLMYQLRDNFIAAAEGDVTAPLDVRLGHILLGTMATTSGSTVTLSGLDLTKFRFIKFVFNGVSLNAGASITFGGGTVYQAVTGGETIYGNGEVDLFSGIGFSIMASVGGPPGGAEKTPFAVRTSITTASTSVSCSSVSNFDAGSIRVYGVK